MAKIVPPFRSKETKKEEKAEKKVSPAAYKRGEKMEGEKPQKFANGGMPMQAQAGLARRPAMPAQANAGGAMRGQARAEQVKPVAMYADGGMVSEYCGHKSEQDYGKKGK